MFDWIVLIGAITGLLMVVGSMLLLWKGVISLNAASAGDGIAVEIANEIKLSTRYPAIALFVIGLLFFLCSIWFCQKGILKTISLEGEISSPSEIKGIKLYVVAGPWTVIVDDETGKVKYTFHPHLKNMKVEVIAPGYSGSGKEKTLHIDGDKILLGKIDIGRYVTKDIKPQKNIIPRQKAINKPGG